MGEISEMIMEGVLCEECGSFVDDEPPDHPRLCHDCIVQARQVKEKDKNLRNRTQYIIEVRGANASYATIGPFDDDVRAYTSGKLGWVTCVAWGGEFEHQVALYSSRKVAEGVMNKTQLFSGQQYRIKTARNYVKKKGILIR